MLNLSCRFLGILLFGKALLSGSAFASTAHHHDIALEEQVKQAELVFEGTVTDVQYRMADIQSGEEVRQVPYTFVTYDVDHFIKGSTDDNTVTLRFLGGPEDDDNFVLIPGQPLFDEGDRDVLMVRANEQYPCPLVNCSGGRFRMVDGLMVNEIGQTLILSDEGHIELGQPVNLEEINHHTMTETIQLERQEVTEIDDNEIVDVEDLKDPEEGFRPDPAGFVSFVEDKVKLVHSSEELAQLTPFKNANPDAPIRDKVIEQVFAEASAPPTLMEEHEDELDQEAMDAQELVENGSQEPVKKVVKSHAEHAEHSHDHHSHMGDTVAVVQPNDTGLHTDQTPPILLAEVPSQGGLFRWVFAAIFVCVLILLYLRKRERY